MEASLRKQIMTVAEEAEALACAVSIYDYASRTSWSYRGDRWFHAASTIKVAVLVGLFARIDQGLLDLDNRLHVRNRFIGVYDHKAYRISPSRDPNDAVHRAIGKLMRLRELAHHMIATSSNLATNLLLDLVGVDTIRETLEHFGVAGIDLRRGVEDEAAFEADINNRVTADGLMSLFRLIEERRAFSEDAAQGILDILHRQEFRSGIPAGVPDEVRTETQFAHKTGDISSVTHDAGIVYLPGRSPYVVALLTEWGPDAKNRKETVARLSRAVYDHLSEVELEEHE
jgi:beta-lactamase class A